MAKPTFETNGTHYTEGTDPSVVHYLEAFRGSDDRLILYYGDTKTGRAWGDKETGRIGRSTGKIKVPLICHNARSLGGGAILTDCVVRIETAKGKRALWQHDTFHHSGQCYACNTDRPDLSKPCPKCKIR